MVNWIDGVTKLSANNLNKMQEDLQGEITVEDFKDKVIFAEDVTENIYNIECIRKGNIVYIRYQGQATTHTGGESSGTLLFTVPSGYVPKNGDCFSPFVKNGNTYGVVAIRTGTGECRVTFISSTSNSGRIYFNTFYTI